MPRRRRRRSQQPSPRKAHTLSPEHPHIAVIDSDADTASLPDSVCEDYVANISSDQIQAVGNTPEYEPLDLTKGLSVDLVSPEYPEVEVVDDDDLSGSDDDDTPAEQEVNQYTAVEENDGFITMEISQLDVRSASISDEGNDIPIPTNLRQGQRATWILVSAQIMEAYHHFQNNAFRGATFQCVPMPFNKTRLAMHRCAEAIGARSQSTGSGRERFVTLTWNKDGKFPLSEQDVRESVHNVLTEMFLSNGDPMEKLLKRRALRKAKKLRTEAHFAKDFEDMELVESLVANKDWGALERLFDGRDPPSSGRKKNRKKKASANSRSRKATSSTAQGRDRPNKVKENGDSGPSTSGWNPNTHAGAAVLAKPLENTNKGFAMLSKMGWQEGEGLGVEKKGRTEPVRPERLFTRAGLGS